MTTIINGGSGDTDVKAETVSPCNCRPLLIVTMVTPEGKCRRASLNDSEFIGIASSWLDYYHAYLGCYLFYHFGLVVFDTQETSTDIGDIGQILNLLRIFSVIGTEQYGWNRISTVLSMVFLLDVAMITGDNK